MSIVKGLNKLSEGINKICLVLIVLMLGAMVVVTTAQIICRSFFSALQWSEEMNRYLLVWSTFIGASCVYKSGTHISITFLHGFFSPKVQRGIRVLVHVLCIVVFCAIVVFGFEYAIKQVQTAPSLHIPMKYMYMSIPLGFGIMIIHAVNEIVTILQTKGGKLK